MIQNSDTKWTYHIATVTKISITLHADMMTKGKAPATMMMIQIHEEQREAIAVAEIHHMTLRVKGMILHHPHQAAPMAAAVAAQPGHMPLEKIRRTRSHTTCVPT
jgi:uncharacterized protein YqfA (UPF0365 family)